MVKVSAFLLLGASIVAAAPLSSSAIEGTELEARKFNPFKAVGKIFGREEEHAIVARYSELEGRKFNPFKAVGKIFGREELEEVIVARDFNELEERKFNPFKAVGKIFGREEEDAIVARDAPELEERKFNPFKAVGKIFGRDAGGEFGEDALEARDYVFSDAEEVESREPEPEPIVPLLLGGAKLFGGRKREEELDAREPEPFLPFLIGGAKLLGRK